MLVGQCYDFDLTNCCQSHLDRLPANHSEAFDPALVPDDDVGAVVIGFNQFFNYRLLAYAHHVLFRKPDNLFIATNLDPQLPQKDRLWPGGGALVASLRVRLFVLRRAFSLTTPASIQLNANQWLWANHRFRCWI